jgi:hypothetical protein
VKEGIKLYCDIDPALIYLGRGLQKDFPGESNFLISLDEEPFLDILHISVAPRELTEKINDESIYRFNKYCDFIEKILKFKHIDATGNIVSRAFATGLAAQMALKYPGDIGVFYSEEHEILCFVAPQCVEHVEASEVN